MKEVNLYTDGACRGNPGRGGWGAILVYGRHEKELSGALSAIYRECTGEFPTESNVKNVRAMITYAKMDKGKWQACIVADG